MGQIRNSDGYRKNTSKDGLRSPHISEKIAKKIDVVARYKGINFTKCCEIALEEYISNYLNTLDIIERQELLELLWSEV